MQYKRDVPIIMLKKPIRLICPSFRCARLLAAFLHLLGYKKGIIPSIIKTKQRAAPKSVHTSNAHKGQRFNPMGSIEQYQFNINSILF
jgi:rhodanese-related sulfurtransferase